MKNKTKKKVLVSLFSTLLSFSMLLPCYAEGVNEDPMLYDDNEISDEITLYAYYNSEDNRVYSQICVFSDENLPEIFCSYDNKNFNATEASYGNSFSFALNSDYEKVYVKAVQTLKDGTVIKSETKEVSTAAPISLCEEDGEELGYVPDSHLGEPITVVPRNFGYLFYQYPHGSYFSKTGVACTCHSYCEWYNPGDCIVFNKAIQCAGFAQKVHYEITGRDIDTTEVNEYMTVAKAKRYFKTASNGELVGTYLRVDTASGCEHSIAIVLTTDTSLIVYHANYDGGCLVRYETYTWENFVKAFPYVYRYSK